MLADNGSPGGNTTQTQVGWLVLPGWIQLPFNTRSSPSHPPKLEKKQQFSSSRILNLVSCKLIPLEGGALWLQPSHYIAMSMPARLHKIHKTKAKSWLKKRMLTSISTSGSLHTCLCDLNIQKLIGYLDG